MNKNKSWLKPFYYATTIFTSFLGLIIASRLYDYEIVVRGSLGIATILLIIYYVTHTKQGGTFNEPFHLETFIKRSVVLLVFAVIVSWAVEEAINLIFYFIGF